MSKSYRKTPQHNYGIGTDIVSYAVKIMSLLQALYDIQYYGSQQTAVFPKMSHFQSGVFQGCTVRGHIEFDNTGVVCAFHTLNLKIGLQFAVAVSLSSE